MYPLQNCVSHILYKYLGNSLAAVRLSWIYEMLLYILLLTLIQIGKKELFWLSAADKNLGVKKWVNQISSFQKLRIFLIWNLLSNVKKCPITQKGFFNHFASEKIRGTITSANILYWSSSKINSTYCCKSHNKAFKFYLPNEILSFLQHFSINIR